MKLTSAFLVLTCLLSAASATHAESRSSVSQYGITWTFDKEYEVGQFITGDWWVVGPAIVVSVTPNPGPAAQGAPSTQVSSRYGAAAMVADDRMRNGSMVLTGPASGQGYDSRLKNYDPKLSVAFPYKLGGDKSLISSVSSTEVGVPVLLASMMWKNETQGTFALKSAAVLTGVSERPPEDAFRPAYVGRADQFIREQDIRWDLLPKLKPPAVVPDWDQQSRFFERPWLDHVQSWLFQYLGPYENQPNYGREFARATSVTSLMLMLDVPRERRRPLMYRFLQFGIDLRGVAASGRNWPADGGHRNGRKWPILFSGLMLRQDISSWMPPTTVFSEDQQTYYGLGASGQTALYQMVNHSGPTFPYEEKTVDLWTDADRKSASYRTVCSVGWPGTALAVQLMKAKALWNHDAFFDYCDRWMSNDTQPERKGIYGIGGNGRVDPFVGEMWDAYRTQVESQPGGERNQMWVWTDKKKGRFVDNPSSQPSTPR